MRLENSFTVPGDATAAWKLLLDVPAVAPCLPGAELTEVAGPRAYKGRAKVKVGPVLLAFAGTAEIVEIEEQARRARVRARGADEKGRGRAEANVVFSLQEESGHTRVVVVTDLNLVGAVAQYGRATGLLHGIAAQLTSDFADNLKALIAERETSTPDASREQVRPPVPAQPIGGLSLLWRAGVAAIKRWFGLSAKTSP
jgi:carbon monoxide dehydrogenase subunit G